MSSKKNIVADVACQSHADVACISQDVMELKEFNYMGLSDSTSTESSTISNISDENSSDLSLKTNFLGSNFKETELRLGLPGSQSPEIYSEHCQLSIAKLDDKHLFPVLNVNYPLSQKTVVLGQKRPFSAAMIEFSERKFDSNSEASAMPSIENTINFSTKSVNREINNGAPFAKMKEPLLRLVSQEQTCEANKSSVNYAIASNNNGEPPAKVQVVGWPPIPSFRKTNTLAVPINNTKEEEEEEEAKKTKGIFVKVSMDGAPYLRKVDLKAYSAYQDLSSGLKKMFISYTFGQYGSHGAASKEITSEGKLKDMLHGCEYILTYEDKDGDLMLLGDVPWEMFVHTCKRLRIMNGLDAIGLAPRAMKYVEARDR